MFLTYAKFVVVYSLIVIDKNLYLTNYEMKSYKQFYFIIATNYCIKSLILFANKNLMC